MGLLYLLDAGAQKIGYTDALIHIFGKKILHDTWDLERFSEFC